MSHVLLVGVDTGGFLTGLEHGLRSLGYQVTRSGPASEVGYSKFENNGFQINRKFLSNRFARKVFADFEIVIYNHGESATGKPKEFRVMRKLGKKLIFVFHGSDVRPAYLNGAIWRGKSIELGNLRKLVRYQKKVVKRAEKYASLIVCWSGITHFFSKTVHLHEHLGFPLSSWHDLVNPVEPSKPNLNRTESVRVLHAPSSPAAKGTPEIESVLASLQTSEALLEYERISGLPNSSVLEKIKGADFVIDQLYADTAGGVFAAEASLLGKAVVVGVLDKNWLTEFLGSSTPPTCLIDPMDLAMEVRTLATDPEYRQKRAEEARSFFSHLWNPENVARQYISVLDNHENRSTGVDPRTIHQARGGYAPRDQISERLKEYLKRFGVKALGLGHNVKLEESVLRTFSNRKDGYPD